MKRIITIAAICLVSGAALNAKDDKITVNFPQYKFKTELENPITSVKNQHRSGTCWAFSTIGFVESEIIRINGLDDPEKYPDLSEFFIISNSYSERADKYVMLDGRLGFSAGSSGDDVLDVIRDHGLVPNEAMTGMNYGTPLPVQAELDKVLKAYVDAVVANPNGQLSTAWKRGFQAVLNEYYGVCPTEFEVDGVKYTPESYRDFLKFNPDDYVTLTSYTHHPFYTWFALEVCDNWRWDKYFNVPVDEMMELLDEALKAGYTAAWGADVSEPGFSRDGLAILVDVASSNNSGSDQEHWVGKNNKIEIGNGKARIYEKTPTQESRQEGYMRKTITDDHGMQIFGIAYDQWGTKYYMVKNSWGTSSKYQGIWYASEAFVKSQTLDLCFHKDVVKAYAEKHPEILDKK